MKSYESRMTGMLRTVLPNRVKIEFRSWRWHFSIGGVETSTHLHSGGDLRRKLTGSTVVDILHDAMENANPGELRRWLKAAEKVAQRLTEQGWIEGREP